jgi:alpha-tubulin suppressor-like RCC1 family protein
MCDGDCDPCTEDCQYKCIKKPRKPACFDSELPNSKTVTKIVCGGMHTVALTSDG